MVGKSFKVSSYSFLTEVVLLMHTMLLLPQQCEEATSYAHFTEEQIEAISQETLTNSFESLAFC